MCNRLASALVEVDHGELLVRPLRYICLSDLHIGQDQSVLTNLAGSRVDPSLPSPTLRAMVECFRDLIAKVGGERPPTLILLGDVVELALSDSNVSAAAFERFVELWVRDGRCMFERVIYVAGNHDHHVWENARDHHRIEWLRTAPATDHESRVLHVTPLMQPIAGDHSLPGAVLHRALGDLADKVPIDIYYPNLALRSGTGERVALFTHGNYFESIYRLMSSLNGLVFPGSPAPITVEELERENFAWIDFFWSMVGREGPVGEHVELVYDSLAFPGKLETIVKNIVDGLIARSSEGAIEKFVTRKALEWVVQRVLEHLLESDRKQTPDLLSRALQNGMREYVEGPLRRQVEAELGASAPVSTLVFGHTHKPFETTWRFAGYPGSVELYNTGGWAIDPAPAVQTAHGGAALLFDDELHAASLRFYNEQAKPEGYSVRVSAAGEGNVFSHAVAAAVDPKAPPYRTFSEAVAGECTARFELLEKVLDGADPGTDD